MKKSLLAVAMAATLVAACAPEKEAKAAGVTVYGSAEQALTTTNGVSDLASGDNYIGFNASEDFGNGTGAFAKIELGVDPEGTNTMSTRESFVGLNLNGLTITAGKQKNLEKVMLNGLVDIFEGNSVTTANQARVNNAVSAVTSVGSVTVGAASITEGTSGEDGVDAYELGAKGEIAGLTAVVTYTKNQTTDADSVSYGASTTFGGLTVGATMEPDSDTNTVAGSMDFGANTVKVATQMVDGGNDTNVAELQHNFSKNTNAYVNWSKEDGSDASTMVGMRITF